jgi:hypothetical protein
MRRFHPALTSIIVSSLNCGGGAATGVDWTGVTIAFATDGAGGWA